MNLATLDLNLLLALDALLREVNVTRAAQSLNLTQPTLSASLARLRKHFDDELLRRNGNQLELTPLALQLRPLVADALGCAERVFSAHTNFEPGESDRRFTLVASDYGLTVAGARISRQLAVAAPRMQLVLRRLTLEALDPPEVRTREVDGVLAPYSLLPEQLPHMDVLYDRWVVIVDADNRAVSGQPDMNEMRNAAWATAFEGMQNVPAGITPRDWALISGRVEVVVDSFAVLPACVRHTARLALIQEQMLAALDCRGLRVLTPPFAVEPITLAFWWHPTHTSDPAHLWFRSQLQNLSASSK